MSRFAIPENFRCRPGTGGRFLERVAVNAAESVRAEPGRYRFDVMTERGGDPKTRTLCESYRDGAAFEAHLNAPHFAAFGQAMAEMVETTMLRMCDVRENAV